jgi:hypothetical protein
MVLLELLGSNLHIGASKPALRGFPMCTSDPEL